MRKIDFTGVVLTCLALLIASPALAGPTPFTIKDRSSSLDQNDPIQKALWDALNEAADAVENDINNGPLLESDRQAFATAMAKANTSATSGIVMDRASEPSRVSISGGARLGFYGSLDTAFQNELVKLPEAGGSLQAAASVSLRGSALGFKKLGEIPLDQLIIYLNGMSLSLNYSGVRANITNFGAHFQYKLMGGVGTSFLARWGGLTLGTGMSYSSNTASYNSKLETTIPGNGVTMSTSLTYALGVESTNFTLPLEISTNATLLYLFTLYGGAGVDVNVGTSKLVGSASGPVNASTTSGITTDNLFSGTASVNLDDGVKGSPALLVPRGFIGLQTNLWVLKLSVEAAALARGTTAYSGMVRFNF